MQWEKEKSCGQKELPKRFLTKSGDQAHERQDKALEKGSSPPKTVAVTAPRPSTTRARTSPSTVSMASANGEGK